MKYTWGYIKECVLSKMDITQSEALEQGYINKMPYFANEAMSQICSTAKPKHCVFELTVVSKEKRWKMAQKYAKQNNLLLPIKYWSNMEIDKLNSLTQDEETFWEYFDTIYVVDRQMEMPDDFFAFDDNSATIEEEYYDQYAHNDNNYYPIRQVYDEELEYCTDNTIVCRVPGKYSLYYKAYWFYITSSTKDKETLKAPDDVINCLATYIASQLYKIDDELKGQYLRNEFEILLARLDDTYFKHTESIRIGGDW